MIIYLLWQILRVSFSTALVMAYVELGPGGEYLGNLIDAFKSYIVTVDWNVIGSKLIQVITGFLSGLVDMLREASELK